MVDIRSILCAIDFSEHSRRALQHAVALARVYHSTIMVLHVAPLLPPGSLTAAARQALLEDMRRFVEAEHTGDVPVELLLAEGNTVTEIAGRVHARSADLLVVGTHGRSGFDRLVLGSVTEKVMRTAECPVLSVPRPPGDAPAGPVSVTRVLCPVDFSDASLKALRYAASLARHTQARLILLHVIELESRISPDLYETVAAGIDRLAPFVKASEEDSRARLEGLVPDSMRSPGAVEVTVGRGTAHREILRVAGEQPADLIVMGAHGRGAVELIFFGSTTQHVVRTAACPVLAVRRD